jgi:hypothetical protein
MVELVAGYVELCGGQWFNSELSQIFFSGINPLFSGWGYVATARHDVYEYTHMGGDVLVPQRRTTWVSTLKITDV